MSLGSHSGIELFEAASNAFCNLFAFEFVVFAGLLEQLLIGFIFEIGELIMFERRLIRISGIDIN